MKSILSFVICLAGVFDAVLVHSTLVPSLLAVEMKTSGRKDTEITRNTIIGAEIWSQLYLEWNDMGNSTDGFSPLDATWTYVVRPESDSRTVVATGNFSLVNDDEDHGLTLDLMTSHWKLESGGFSAYTVYLTNGDAGVLTSFNVNNKGDGAVVSEKTASIHAIPGWITILPLIVLIIIAVTTHQNLFAMFIGVWIAASFINHYNPILGFTDSISTFMVMAMNDPERIKIILFTFFLSGMIGLITKSGGAEGMAKAITKYATNRSRALWMTFTLGCIIFFDDYASALIVGNNMRPITDMLFISREKLAFLVHATSSPPASVAPISSWIGFEIGAIRDQLQAIPEYKDEDAFMIFLETIPTRFYPIFMLLFIVIQIIMRRDFGPMLVAERRAMFEKKVVRDSCVINSNDLDDSMNIPCRWYNAVIPIATCLIVTVISLFLTGYYTCIALGIEDATIADIAGNGSSSDALIWGSLLGSMISMILVRVQRILPFHKSMGAWVDGIRGLVDALLTLLMAWTISATFKELGLPQFVTQGLSGALDPRALPACVFLTSCFISFSLGSSWGTMSIMFPLAIPLAYGLAPTNRGLIVDVISSILTGSIFGDQCSPLADTSILSSLSSQVPVKDHIKTQLPYALLVAITALLVGYLPAGYDLFPSYVSIIIGIVIMSGLLYLMGVETESTIPGKFQNIGRLFKRNRRASKTKNEMTIVSKDEDVNLL